MRVDYGVSHVNVVTEGILLTSLWYFWITNGKNSILKHLYMYMYISIFFAIPKNVKNSNFIKNKMEVRPHECFLTSKKKKKIILQ